MKNRNVRSPSDIRKENTQCIIFYTLFSMLSYPCNCISKRMQFDIETCVALQRQSKRFVQSQRMKRNKYLIGVCFLLAILKYLLHSVF